MKLLHRLLLISLGTLLRLCLFFGVSLLAIVILFGKPGHVEQAIASEGVYREFVPAVTQEISTQDQATNPIPFNDPGVKKIINDAFPPQLLQTNAELVINNFYSWLQDKIVVPNYTVDFTSQRQLLANNLTAYAFNHLAAQPVCSVQPTTVNPFTDTCLPRNFNLDTQRAAFTKELDNLLPQTVFTAKDLPKLSNGKTFVDAFPQIPTAYKVIMWSPWVIGSILLLLVALMIGLATTPRRGIRLVGSATLSAGITLIITPLLYELVYPTVERALSIQTHNSGLNNLSTLVIQNLSHQFYDIIISASLMVIGAGVLILFGERMTRNTGYEDLAQKAGLQTSDSPTRKTGHGNSVGPDDVPLQTSERVRETSVSKKNQKKYRTLKRMKDKE